VPEFCGCLSWRGKKTVCLLDGLSPTHAQRGTALAFAVRQERWYKLAADRNRLACCLIRGAVSVEVLPALMVRRTFLFMVRSGGQAPSGRHGSRRTNIGGIALKCAARA